MRFMPIHKKCKINPHPLNILTWFVFQVPLHLVKIHPKGNKLDRNICLHIALGKYNFGVGKLRLLLSPGQEFIWEANENVGYKENIIQSIKKIK